MDQALTNKKFIEQIDDVIETLGGTPVDLELTEDREDDMVSNGVFVDKMDEVIEALGGTPSEIIVGDDKADDMVSDNIFQLKMEDVVKNMSGGGGGGNSDFDYMHKVEVYSFDAATETVVLDITAAELYAAESTMYFELTEEQVSQMSSSFKPEANTPVACLKSKYYDDTQDYDFTFTELRMVHITPNECYANSIPADDKVTIVYDQ